MWHDLLVLFESGQSKTSSGFDISPLLQDPKHF
jgi:hypothetical protein